MVGRWVLDAHHSPCGKGLDVAISLMSADVNAYSPREELANTLTHGIGAVLGVVGLGVLVKLADQHGDVWRMASAWVFGLSIILLYAASTAYHASRDPDKKRFLRKLDHAGIFLLIAGTYTPFLLVNLRGPWGWWLFGVIWGLAITGLILKFWFTGRFRIVSMALYLGMGWLVVVAAKPMLAAVPHDGLWLLLAGGLSYTFGTLFYAWKSLAYHHGLWHLCVLGGSACHFAAVLVSVYLVG